MEAFFELARMDEGSEALMPLGPSASGWRPNMMRGMAVSGVLARSAEACVVEAADGLVPARWSVDLLRPASMSSCAATSRILRAGRRICLVESNLVQDQRLVARATALFARTDSTVMGQVWSREEVLPVPDAYVVPDGDLRSYFTASTGWTGTGVELQTSSRKALWQWTRNIVSHEDATPFQLAASAADAANVVVNWGTRGLEYINADLNLTMIRTPEAGEVGLATIERAEQRGVAGGVSAMYDRQGVLGWCTVSSLANAAGSVDLANRHMS